MPSLAAASAFPEFNSAITRQVGAYARVHDDLGRLLVLRGENGRWYLPGGRIEWGETPQEALAREIEEECGWSADILQAAGAGEHRIFGGAVFLSASYWDARLRAPLGRASEHEMVWLSPLEAAFRLHRAGDRRLARAAASG